MGCLQDNVSALDKSKLGEEKKRGRWGGGKEFLGEAQATVMGRQVPHWCAALSRHSLTSRRPPSSLLVGSKQERREEENPFCSLLLGALETAAGA